MKKILIVDDDADIAHRLDAFLKKNNWVTTIAPTVSQAIDSVEKVNPDVVLLDVMLPDGLGVAVDRFVRQHPNLYTTTAIIYQTVVNDEDSRTLINKHRPDGYLNKPYSPKQLLETIESALQSLQHGKADSGNYAANVTLLSREIDFRITRVVDVHLLAIELTQRGKSGNESVVRDKTSALIKAAKTTINVCSYWEAKVFVIGDGMVIVMLVDNSVEKFTKNLKEVLHTNKSIFNLSFEHDLICEAMTFEADKWKQRPIAELVRKVNNRFTKALKAHTVEHAKDPKGHSAWVD